MKLVWATGFPTSSMYLGTVSLVVTSADGKCKIFDMPSQKHVGCAQTVAVFKAKGKRTAIYDIWFGNATVLSDNAR